MDGSNTALDDLKRSLTALNDGRGLFGILNKTKIHSDELPDELDHLILEEGNKENPQFDFNKVDSIPRVGFI